MPSWIRIRTTPHQDNSPPCRYIDPDEWFYSLVMVLVGSSPRDHVPGGQKLGFILIQWGIVPGGELS